MDFLQNLSLNMEEQNEKPEKPLKLKVKAEPFTKLEDTRLLKLVTKYQHIIECKKTDHKNNLLKSQIWETIARQFNQEQELGPHRGANTLLTRYRNKKTRGKKDFADRQMWAFFGEDEKKRLIEIMEELQPSNLTDMVWAQIVERFNGEDIAPRTQAELEQLYNKCKAETKQKMRTEAKSVKVTGGGNYTHVHYSQEEEQLSALLKNRLHGNAPVYDADHDQLQLEGFHNHGYAEQSVDDFEGSYEIEEVVLDDDQEPLQQAYAPDSSGPSISRNVPFNEVSKKRKLEDVQMNPTNSISIGTDKKKLKTAFEAEENEIEPTSGRTMAWNKKSIAPPNNQKSACSSTATQDARSRKIKPTFSITDGNNLNATVTKDTKTWPEREHTTIWEKNTTPLLKLPKSACLSTATEPCTETKRQREHKNSVSDWTKSKVDLSKLQYDAAAENLRKKTARDDEDYMTKKRRAEELHAIKVATEKKLGELQVKEMELRIHHIVQKQELELEILKLEKNIKQKILGQNGKD